MAIQTALCCPNLGLQVGSSGPLDWGGGMNPVLGFGDDGCFGFRQPQQQQIYQTQWVENLGIENENSQVEASSSCGHQFLSMEIEKQRQEIELFLRLQDDRLRSTLQERRNQELAIMLRSMESRVTNILLQKEAELAEATNKSKKLEESLQRLGMENEAWHRVAEENESTVTYLKTMLRQIKEEEELFDARSSSCESSRNVVREKTAAAAAGGGGEEDGEGKMGCKACNGGIARVVFLPCMHLCCCKACEAFLDLCPVCKCVKKASMDVFLGY